MMPSTDTVTTEQRHQQWDAACDDIAQQERIEREHAIEDQIEQSVGFHAVVARRYCRHVVVTVLSRSSRVWIADGCVDVESTRRDEMLARLRPYNRVLDSTGESYAAWMLRKMTL